MFQMTLIDEVECMLECKRSVNTWLYSDTVREGRNIEHDKTSIIRLKSAISSLLSPGDKQRNHVALTKPQWHDKGGFDDS